MNAHTKIPSDIIGLITPAPVSRRGFFMTASAAAAAGYTLAAGPVRAQVVTTDTKGLKAGDATVKVAGGDMPVYWARPEKGSNHPVVIVAMEIFGLHEHIADVARRFARQGYLALAPELFVRQGDAGSYGEIAKLIAAQHVRGIVLGLPLNRVHAVAVAGLADRAGIDVVVLAIAQLKQTEGTFARHTRRQHQHVVLPAVGDADRRRHAGLDIDLFVGPATEPTAVDAHVRPIVRLLVGLDVLVDRVRA